MRCRGWEFVELTFSLNFARDEMAGTRAHTHMPVSHPCFCVLTAASFGNVYEVEIRKSRASDSLQTCCSLLVVATADYQQGTNLQL
jgi:hypothetical protein